MSATTKTPQRCTTTRGGAQCIFPLNHGSFCEPMFDAEHPDPGETMAIFGETICSYTREQAIEDGELVDVTEWASAEKGFHGGFTIPVALTRSAWAAIEMIPTALEGIADVRGRAHDVLWMASLATRRTNGESRVGFKVILPSKGTRTRNRTLFVDIGPGDAGEPVVTIGFSEDF